jgi:hypothetical protein
VSAITKSAGWVFLFIRCRQSTAMNRCSYTRGSADWQQATQKRRH